MKTRRGLLKPPRAIAVYLFYRSGEPLVALAAGRDLPIEAETLEGLLSVGGNFVETSVRGSRGYATTAMRYDEFGIVAARGGIVIRGAFASVHGSLSRARPPWMNKVLSSPRETRMGRPSTSSERSRPP